MIERLDAEASEGWFNITPEDGSTFSPNVKPLADMTAYAPKEQGRSNSHVVIHPRIAGTLCASGAGMSRSAGMASELDFVVIAKSLRHANEPYVVRRFTPLECERLQGFPDHWTDVPYRGRLVSDGHRYKALGNTMPCPVMTFIGDMLAIHFDLLQAIENAPDVVADKKTKRGRPPKHGVAMTDAERQRKRRKRLQEAASKAEEIGNGIPDLVKSVSSLRIAIEKGTPHIYERLDALEAILQRLGR